LPSTGKSALLVTVTIEPVPLHWLTLQSPAVCVAVDVPADVYEKPHTPALQDRAWHSLSIPGQSLATMQPTH
jgi:hypothetical protein